MVELSENAQLITGRLVWLTPSPVHTGKWTTHTVWKLYTTSHPTVRQHWTFRGRSILTSWKRGSSVAWTLWKCTYYRSSLFVDSVFEILPPFLNVWAKINPCGTSVVPCRYGRMAVTLSYLTCMLVLSWVLRRCSAFLFHVSSYQQMPLAESS